MLKKLKPNKSIIAITLLLVAMFLPSMAYADTVDLAQNGDFSESVNTIIFLTITMMGPFIIMCCTCFPRYIIGLSFLKQALGVQQVPPSQIIIGISIILSMFTMTPTVNRIIDEAYTPYKEEQITSKEMYEKSTLIAKEFMLQYTSEDNLLLMAEAQGIDELPESKEDLNFWVVSSAYLISELTKVTLMGALFYVIFIGIDLLVAAVLMAMGMVMLPPASISILIKLIVFLAADGWHNIIKMLVHSF